MREEEEEPAIEDVQEETQLDLSGDSVKSIAKLWDSKMVSGGPRHADAGSSPLFLVGPGL